MYVCTLNRRNQNTHSITILSIKWKIYGMWKAVSWYSMWLRIRKIVLKRGFCLARLWHKFLWYEFVFLLIMITYLLFVVWCFRLVWKLDLSILYVVHFCKFWTIILVIYRKIPLIRLPIIQIFWSSKTWGEQLQD